MLLKKKLRLSYWSAAALSRFVEIYCTSLESHFLPLLFLGVGGSDLDVQFPTRLSFFEVSVHVKEWEIVAVLEVVLLFMFRIFCRSKIHIINFENQLLRLLKTHLNMFLLYFFKLDIRRNKLFKQKKHTWCSLFLKELGSSGQRKKIH